MHIGVFIPINNTGWIISAFVVLALAAIGGFVLVPATRVIERQVADLRAARDRLEDRVRERTAELEASHRDLENEHRERLAHLASLGFDDLYLHHVGQEQEAFIDSFGAEVIPRLTTSTPTHA